MNSKQQIITDLATDLRSVATRMNVECGWAGSEQIHKIIVSLAEIRAHLSSLEYQLYKQEQEKVKL